MSGLSGPLSWPGPRPCALLLLFLLGPSSVLAISFHLPVNSRKCLREEIHKDLLVTGAYEITDQSGGAGGLRTHLKVRRGGGRPDGRRRAGEAEVVGRPARGRRPGVGLLPHPSAQDVRCGPPLHPARWGSRGGAARPNPGPVEGLGRRWRAESLESLDYFGCRQGPAPGRAQESSAIT